MRGLARGLRRRPSWLALLLAGCWLLMDGLHWRGRAGSPFAAPERGSPAALNPLPSLRLEVAFSLFSGLRDFRATGSAQ